MILTNSVVDLSHHNATVDFTAMKHAGIQAVFHKATESSNFTDARYVERSALAGEAELLFGAYHFASSADVGQQVDHFLSTIYDSRPGLMVLDFEPNPREGTMSLQQAEQFVQSVYDQTGSYPGIYSGQSFINEQLGRRTDTPLNNCFLWIARYSADVPKIPAAFDKFTLWQYTDGSAGPEPHQVPGVGRCDRNKFNGTPDELLALWTS